MISLSSMYSHAGKWPHVPLRKTGSRINSIKLWPSSRRPRFPFFVWLSVYKLAQVWDLIERSWLAVLWFKLRLMLTNPRPLPLTQNTNENLVDWPSTSIHQLVNTTGFFESGYSDCYLTPSAVHYNHHSHRLWLSSAATWALPYWIPIIPIAFRDPSSMVAIPTVNSDLQRRATTELFKHPGAPFTNIFLTVEVKVCHWTFPGWMIRSYMINLL